MRLTILAHAGAHEIVPAGEAWQHWAPNPGALAMAAAAAIAYALVARTARRRSGARALRAGHILAFAAGLIAMTAALASPLEALAGTLLSFHMGQHVLLMAVAAPLLAYGAPPARMAVGLPEPLRSDARSAAQWLARRPAWALAASALALHVAVVWAFHVSKIYEAALSDPLLHVTEHMLFLATGVLLWWAVLAFGSRTRPSAGAIAALFLLGAQGAALGALMAFATRIWYQAYQPGAAAWDVTPLADQQLAGLLMWGFGGLAPVLVGAALLTGWLDRMQRFPSTMAPARARRR